MPGPKFPSGYNRIFHDIAAKLIAERPERMEVTFPSMQSGYARSHFNYFRQSWLRYYEFLTKHKDHTQAEAALDTYNRLQAYMVQISPPRTLIFTSKEVHSEIDIQVTGRVEEYFHHQLPRHQDAKEIAGKGKAAKHFHIKDPSLLPTELDVQQALKNQEDIIRRLYRSDNPAPITPDNTPDNAPVAETETNKYGLPIGPPPGFLDKK